jgi:hypothetical protein
MSRRTRSAAAGLAILALAIPLVACTRTAEAPTASAQLTAVLPERTKEQNIELGRKHKTALDLYQALKLEAKNGRPLEWTQLPDWSGVYSRPANAGFAFDPDQRPGEGPTAKLTPEYQARLVKRIEEVKRGIEWDPISTCAPPGHPRWLTEPFLREFIVTPNQTWLINEMVNDIRRVYTDGRDHVPQEDRYPIPNGDSIGFWDGPKLVVHTNQLQSGIYQRSHPDYSDQVETVEIWQKTDEKTLTTDVWVYDPPALTEPWYVKQSYVKLTDPDKSLRIRYWHCGENQNNAVVQTKEGSTEFQGFTFDTGTGARESAAQKGKP